MGAHVSTRGRFLPKARSRRQSMPLIASAALTLAGQTIVLVHYSVGSRFTTILVWWQCSRAGTYFGVSAVQRSWRCRSGVQQAFCSLTAGPAAMSRRVSRNAVYQGSTGGAQKCSRRPRDSSPACLAFPQLQRSAWSPLTRTSYIMDTSAMPNWGLTISKRN